MDLREVAEVRLVEMKAQQAALEQEARAIEQVTAQQMRILETERERVLGQLNATMGAVQILETLLAPEREVVTPGGAGGADLVTSGEEGGGAEG